MGRQQYATVSVTSWLVWLVKKSENSDSFLWNYSQQKFRSIFKEVCQRLRLGHCKFSPASLRAGGANWHIDNRGPEVARLRFEGRWSNLRSLEHYVQTARSQQLLLQIPDETSKRISIFIQRFSLLLSLPQFLALKLPPQNLVNPLRCKSTNHAADVARACRLWGKRAGFEETLQEEGDRGRKPEGRPLFGRRACQPGEICTALPRWQ